jgi:hypothetical protein
MFWNLYEDEKNFFFSLNKFYFNSDIDVVYSLRPGIKITFSTVICFWTALKFFLFAEYREIKKKKEKVYLYTLLQLNHQYLEFVFHLKTFFGSQYTYLKSFIGMCESAENDRLMMSLCLPNSFTLFRLTVIYKPIRLCKLTF